MAMRDYEDLKDIDIPSDQEKIMDIICDAWDECRNNIDCKSCKDRPKEYMRIMECTALKYSRKLVEAGFMLSSDAQEIKHGWWEYPFNRDIAKCSECCFCVQDKINNVSEMYKLCPNCGARMDGKKECWKKNL